MIGKSTLAATLAWWVGHDLMHATSAAFAPFSAVLIMNATIYRSVWQALRYTAAVAAGVAVQGALKFLIGSELFAFPLVAVIALAIGQWAALGEQRTQVATAAFFAFSTYTTASTTGDQAAQLGQIVLLVLIGCVLGLIVNLGIAPPLRYRSAEQGIQVLGHEVATLLDDMAEGLREGDVRAERTQAWILAGERAQRSVAQARTGLSMAEDSLPLNPRRLLPAHRGYLTFGRYRQVLVSMERSVFQLASLNRSLDQWQETESTYSYTPVLQAYADFLAALRDIAQVLSALDTDTLTDQAAEASTLAGTAQERLQDVLKAARTAGLPLADPSRPYGVLVVEATRLMEEFQYTCDALQTTATG
ncbi:aromatic acid exporter family protein [Streptomyces sp. H27-C3]|uniref:FUSC family protein n=1 Tax=Streptomyces sp. H27-C3 TaxID=3046305 RepID=UPI0024B94DC0|nr:aromatic acid exporter family protein [Streptomyces sp. H27-C3]MDJ0463783.1 aromatic acid exporter family protein [Streptomyces sp. H27-C3]